MNFFEPTCQEPPINNVLFGLCDDQNGTKAYTNVNDPARWIATVRNNNSQNLVFTAIDKCVVRDHEDIGKGRCDGMLTSSQHIYFVELKEINPPWISSAIGQLESTIVLFMANHDISIFRHKKAFACNRKRDKFYVIDHELNLRFFRTYGVRIDVQAEIIVI
jgi:hypothetical protein